MTRSNLTIREIRDSLRAGKPCYLGTETRNVRIYRVRVYKKQFQVEPMDLIDGKPKWMDADQAKVVCAY